MPIDPEALNARIKAEPGLPEELAAAPWPAGEGDPVAHDAEIRPLRAQMTALLGQLAAKENELREKGDSPELEAELQDLRKQQEDLDGKIAPLAAVRVGLDDQAAADLLNRVRERVLIAVPVLPKQAKVLLAKSLKLRRFEDPTEAEKTRLEALPSLPGGFSAYDLVLQAGRLLLDPDFADEDLTDPVNAGVWQALAQIPYAYDGQGQPTASYLAAEDVAGISALGQRPGSLIEAWFGAGVVATAKDLSEAR